MNELDIFEDKEIEKLMYNSSSLDELPPITDTMMGDPDSHVAIIVQHGFIGSNLELLYLANQIAKEGYRLLIPILPGHGANFKALHLSNHQDWQNGLDQSIQYLLDEKPDRDIYIIAHSLGGCLALLASLKYSQIKFVSTMATPLSYPPPVHHLAKLMNKIKPDLLIEYRDFRFHDKRLGHHPYVEYLKDNYPAVSVKTLHDVILLMEKTEKHLAEVTVPLLVFYPKLDNTVWFTSSWRIYSRVNSVRKGFVTLYQSNHIVPAESDKQIVVEKLIYFMNKLSNCK